MASQFILEANKRPQGFIEQPQYDADTSESENEDSS